MSDSSSWCEDVVLFVDVFFLKLLSAWVHTLWLFLFTSKLPWRYLSFLLFGKSNNFLKSLPSSKSTSRSFEQPFPFKRNHLIHSISHSLLTVIFFDNSYLCPEHQHSMIYPISTSTIISGRSCLLFLVSSTKKTFQEDQAFNAVRVIVFREKPLKRQTPSTLEFCKYHLPISSNSLPLTDYSALFTNKTIFVCWNMTLRFQTKP